MLILPLHQPLTAANFPRATALLVLVNLFVFFVLQSGDQKAWAAARDYYRSSGLLALEKPLYEKHLAQSQEQSRLRELQKLRAVERENVQLAWQVQDDLFRERLRQGELFVDAEQHAAWQRLDAEFQRQRARVFTERFALQAAAPKLPTLLSSMFLHGGIDHLLGNLLFLIALGLLVEGGLGAGLFAALYLLSGLGAGLAWAIASRDGSLIGASGAIAGLMGAFCVLWGRRRVRFFYWFFVVFDYIKGPALALLPAWLGWELLQWFLRDGSRVAYEAHAGGIVSGAILAVMVRAVGWQREAFFVSEPVKPDLDAQLEQALQHLGRMRLNEAEALLSALAEQSPQHFAAALAHYRCARYAGHSQQARQRLETLLGLPSLQRDQLREVWTVLSEWGETGAGIAASARLAFAPRLLLIGEPAAAVALALACADDAAVAGELPQAWLSLALRCKEQGQAEAAQRLLGAIVAQCAATPQADKAQFLLQEWTQA